MTSAREKRRSHLRTWARMVWLSLATRRASLRRGCLIWGQGVLQCGCECGYVGKVDRDVERVNGKKRIWKLQGTGDPSRGTGCHGTRQWDGGMRKAGGMVSGIWDLGKGCKSPHLLSAPPPEREGGCPLKSEHITDFHPRPFLLRSFCFSITMMYQEAQHSP